MQIKLSKLLDIISQETEISRKDLHVDAWYQEAGEEYPGLEDFPSEISIKHFLLGEYAKSCDCQKYLSIRIYAKNCQIFSFEAKDISPRKNDVYQFMGIDYHKECVGPGFYYNYPYFYISNFDGQNKSNYLRFLDAVVIDTEKVDVFATPKELSNNMYAKKSESKFLHTLENTTLNESFFKNLPELVNRSSASVKTNSDDRTKQ